MQSPVLCLLAPQKDLSPGSLWNISAGRCALEHLSVSVGCWIALDSATVWGL